MEPDYNGILSKSEKKIKEYQSNLPVKAETCLKRAIRFLQVLLHYKNKKL